MATKIPLNAWQGLLPCLLALAAWAVTSPAGAQWEDHASTVAEGYGRGLADVISAQGDYNLQTSQAAINAEEAIRRDIHNRQLWSEAYYQIRRANRAFVAEQRGRQPTMEDIVRYAQMGMPKRLSPKEFDYVTGKITWPKILQTEFFSDDRGKLEQMFSRRAQMGGVTFDEEMEIRRATNAMLTLLRTRVRELPADYYMGARHFLESLAYEIRLPPNG